MTTNILYEQPNNFRCNITLVILLLLIQLSLTLARKSGLRFRPSFCIFLKISIKTKAWCVESCIKIRRRKSSYRLKLLIISLKTESYIEVKAIQNGKILPEQAYCVRFKTAIIRIYGMRKVCWYLLHAVSCGSLAHSRATCPARMDPAGCSQVLTSLWSNVWVRISTNSNGAATGRECCSAHSVFVPVAGKIRYMEVRVDGPPYTLLSCTQRECFN
jgi:hypothetical protein